MRKKIEEMFVERNHITFVLDKFADIEAKREIVAKSSGPLWYVFGTKLVYKPWLSYEERYDIL